MRPPTNCSRAKRVFRCKSDGQPIWKAGCGGITPARTRLVWPLVHWKCPTFTKQWNTFLKKLKSAAKVTTRKPPGDQSSTDKGGLPSWDNLKPIKISISLTNLFEAAWESWSTNHCTRRDPTLCDKASKLSKIFGPSWDRCTETTASLGWRSKSNCETSSNSSSESCGSDFSQSTAAISTWNFVRRCTLCFQDLRYVWNWCQTRSNQKGLERLVMPAWVSAHWFPLRAKSSSGESVSCSLIWLATLCTVRIPWKRSRVSWICFHKSRCSQVASRERVRNNARKWSTTVWLSIQTWAWPTHVAIQRIALRSPKSSARRIVCCSPGTGPQLIVPKPSAWTAQAAKASFRDVGWSHVPSVKIWRHWPEGWWAKSSTREGRLSKAVHTSSVQGLLGTKPCRVKELGKSCQLANSSRWRTRTWSYLLHSVYLCCRVSGTWQSWHHAETRLSKWLLWKSVKKVPALTIINCVISPNEYRPSALLVSSTSTPARSVKPCRWPAWLAKRWWKKCSKTWSKTAEVHVKTWMNPLSENQRRPWPSSCNPIPSKSERTFPKGPCESVPEKCSQCSCHQSLMMWLALHCLRNEWTVWRNWYQAGSRSVCKSVIRITGEVPAWSHVNPCITPLLNFCKWPSAMTTASQPCKALGNNTWRTFICLVAQGIQAFRNFLKYGKVAWIRSVKTWFLSWWQ